MVYLVYYFGLFNYLLIIFETNKRMHNPSLLFDYIQRQQVNSRDQLSIGFRIFAPITF